MASSAALPAELQGWQGDLRLRFARRAERTVLTGRQRLGPLAVQRPFYPDGRACHVYLLHPPGGVVGGDRLHVELQLEQNAEVLATTPGATKFYRSAGALACQSQHLKIAAGAILEWLPQENIFFSGAIASSSTRIDLEGDGRIAYWEIQCLGRPVVGEGFDAGSMDSSLAITRDGVPLLLDRLRVDPGSRHYAALLGGRPVTATLVMGAVDRGALEASRARIAGAVDQIAASLIDDLLVVRYLGDSTERARQLFIDVWRAVQPMLIGRVGALPRIWAT